MRTVIAEIVVRVTVPSDLPRDECREFADEVEFLAKHLKDVTYSQLGFCRDGGLLSTDAFEVEAEFKSLAPCHDCGAKPGEHEAANGDRVCGDCSIRDLS